MGRRVGRLRYREKEKQRDRERAHNKNTEQNWVAQVVQNHYKTGLPTWGTREVGKGDASFSGLFGALVFFP
jgi:hypothetical protein